MKKTIVILSVLAMMTACLTGCSGTQQPASTPVETPAATTEAAPETTEAATETTEQERTDAQIIEEIVTYHGCYGDEADAKVCELQDELIGRVTVALACAERPSVCCK